MLASEIPEFEHDSRAIFPATWRAEKILIIHERQQEERQGEVVPLRCILLWPTGW